ncbi:hypothetical protein D3C78_1200710 [compost metagenome]
MLLQYILQLGGYGPVRCSEQLRREADRFLHQHIRRLHLINNLLLVQLGHVLMMIGMIANRMSFIDHPLQHLWIFLHLLPDYKKRSLNILFLQYI